MSNFSSTFATQDTDTMSLTSAATISADSEDDSTATPQFGGTIDGFKTDEPTIDN